MIQRGDVPNVALVEITEDHWQDRGPGHISFHHLHVKVLAVYAGHFMPSDEIAMKRTLDARTAGRKPNESVGQRWFVFLSDSPAPELDLDAEEFPTMRYEPSQEAWLDCVFGKPRREPPTQ